MDVLKLLKDGDGSVKTATAYAASKDWTTMTFWLQKMSKPATAEWRTLPGRTVTIGMKVRCQYRKFMKDGDIKYKVTKILEIFNDLHIAKIISFTDSLRLFRFVFDLSQTRPAYFAAECAVSGDTAYIVADKEMVTKMTGYDWSEEMVGWCKYKEGIVPRKIIDKHYEGNENIVGHRWQLVHLVNYADLWSVDQENLVKKSEGKAICFAERADPKPLSSYKKESLAVVTKCESNSTTVFLFREKAAAIMWKLTPKKSVQLGSLISCKYVYGPPKNHCNWEVIEVLGIYEPEKSIKSRRAFNESHMLLRIKFDDVSIRFKNYWNEQPVLKCQYNLYVICAARILTPTSRVTGLQLVEQYKSRDKVLCWCRYALGFVPRMMVDNEYRGSELVFDWAWELIEVVDPDEAKNQKYNTGGFYDPSEEEGTDIA